MHQPVILEEVISSLNLKPGYIALDATIGGGGHGLEILKRIMPGGKLIGLDADEAAIRIASEHLKECAGSFKLINENFRNAELSIYKSIINLIEINDPSIRNHRETHLKNISKESLLRYNKTFQEFEKLYREYGKSIFEPDK